STVESDENFTVTLSGASAGATITTPSAAGLIVNDDAGLAITALSASKAEGNGGGSTAFTFTVTRSGDTSGVTTVTYTVSAGASPAADVADFNPAGFPTGTLTFAAESTRQVLTINVSADSTVESDENFTVTLSGASGGATITTPSAAGPLVNADPGPAITAPGATTPALHDALPISFTFTVTRSGDTSGVTTVTYTVSAGASPATDAADFNPAGFP